MSDPDDNQNNKSQTTRKIQNPEQIKNNEASKKLEGKGTTTPKGEDTTNPKSEGYTEPKSEGTRKRKGEGSRKPKGEGKAKPKSEDTKGDDAANPEGEGTTKLEGEGTTKLDGDGGTTPEGEQTTKPKVDYTTKPKSEGNTKLKNEGTINLKGGDTTTPKDEGITKPNGEDTTKPKGKDTPQPQSESTKPEGGGTTGSESEGTANQEGDSEIEGRIGSDSKDTAESESGGTNDTQSKGTADLNWKDTKTPQGDGNESESEGIIELKGEGTTGSESEGTTNEEGEGNPPSKDKDTTEPGGESPAAPESTGTTESESESTKIPESEGARVNPHPAEAPLHESSPARTSTVEDSQESKQILGSKSRIQHKKETTVSTNLILLVIMTSTITAAIIASIPVFYLLNDNYKVNQELNQLQTQLADVNRRLRVPNSVDSDKDDDDLSQTIESDLASTKERLDKAELQLNQCIRNTSRIANEIKGARSDLSEEISKVKKQAERNLTTVTEETTKYISSNFMSYAKWFPIIGTGLIVELLMVVFGVYLYSRWGNRQHGHHTGNVNQERPRIQNGVIDDPQTQDKTQNKNDEFQGMKWVLSRIKAKKLHNKVCVISFYQETSEKHVQLTRSAMELIDALQNVEVVPVVINKHNELLEIPACKIFIMYVDYNQRNVILEDTKKVLGDLKLTTARAIQKFNADLLLVYVGHKESRELRAEDLYNTNITSVQLHPDLKEISQKKRFLSTYKQFTASQREHISKILNTKLL